MLWRLFDSWRITSLESQSTNGTLEFVYRVIIFIVVWLSEKLILLLSNFTLANQVVVYSKIFKIEIRAKSRAIKKCL